MHARVRLHVTVAGMYHNGAPRAMPDDPSALMRDGEALLVAGDLGRGVELPARDCLAPRFGEA